MDFIWSLFSPRPSYRNYARIDQMGICRALKQCSQQPVGKDWVEVREQNLSWLDQPLPADARLTSRARQPGAQQMRTA